MPSGPIYSIADVFDDAQVKHWGMVETVPHPKLGDLKLLSNPLRLDSIGKQTIRTAPPLLGEHSEAVLRDYGIAEAQIAALIEKAVVHTGEETI